MRLNKYIAMCGVCSRRSADTLIAQGRVKVNGAAAMTMGMDIDPEKDEVCVDGRTLRPRGPQGLHHAEQTGRVHLRLPR